MKFITIFILGLFSLVPYSVFSKTLVEVTSDEIRAEALRKNDAGLGKPLPLAAHWNTGFFDSGYTPKYQLDLISKGHHILPWFHLSSPVHDQPSGKYYDILKKYSDLNIPISFVSTQWEHLLTDDPTFFELGKDENPNAINLIGGVEKKVSPFGPIGAWEKVGGEWTSTELMGKIQKLYERPPIVFFISNNEHKKLNWYESLKSKRYIEKHGPLHGDDYMRRVVGDGWIDRYRAIQSGMRQGLENDSWKNNSRYVGYDAFGGAAFGRWPGWIKYSLQTEERIEPWPLAWDGASVSFYVNNWDSSSDYQVMSPQIQAMNWVFMLEEAKKLNPDFWFEISTWDGHTKDKSDKYKFYALQGVPYTPERYGGMVQFGMWLLRPRVVREFRGWTEKLEDTELYFQEILKAVDRVYHDENLEKFWRKGKLVANNNKKHPYQTNIPQKYIDTNRWFLLEVDINPKRPWKLDTELPVFSLALELGMAPSRSWLIYTYSPLISYSNIKIDLPGYGEVITNSKPSGCFTLINEESSKASVLECKPN